MPDAKFVRLILVAVAGWLPWLGCKGNARPSQPPAPPKKPELTRLAAESLHWTAEEAAARLSDEQLGLSAAVRLVRLAGLSTLCVPDDLTDEHLERLRLAKLSPRLWAVGLADQQEPRRLRAPVLVFADGKVTPLADGTDEEVLVLHISEDSDVFPHLITLPQRVLLLEDDQATTAMVLESPAKVRFELRRERGYGYIGLVLSSCTGQDREVARYQWDPYEMVFVGPAADRLPDPPGGKFQIDLKASPRLVPVGGEIPEPSPRDQPPDTPEQPLRDDDRLAVLSAANSKPVTAQQEVSGGQECAQCETDQATKSRSPVRQTRETRPGTGRFRGQAHATGPDGHRA